MSHTTRRLHLREIFQAALDKVEPYSILMENLELIGSRLTIRMGEQITKIDLSLYEQIYVIGCGKATAPMALALESILGGYLTKGIISVKYGHTVNLSKIETIEADHPVPDNNSVKAAEKILDLVSEAGKETLVISLISGGGSALLTMPIHWKTDSNEGKITLAEKQQTTNILLGCGADIEEINCIRKHLSAIKGGRLLEHISPAKCISFILSDVVGDDLASIASGITAADPTTYQDALEILKKYDIAEKLPSAVLKTILAGVEGGVDETLKPDIPACSLVENYLIGTNRYALDSAARHAEKLGYKTIKLTSRIVGEAREIAKFLAAITLDCAVNGTLTQAPVCILSGGEPVVTLHGKGMGGRNQEMALAYLAEMKKNEHLCANVSFLAASTDGNDGPTDAAGAFADTSVLAAAEKSNLDLHAYLANNDSYNFFKKCQNLLITGPTNTNVCDLHITLID